MTRIAAQRHYTFAEKLLPKVTDEGRFDIRGADGYNRTMRRKGDGT